MSNEATSTITPTTIYHAMADSWGEGALRNLSSGTKLVFSKDCPPVFLNFETIGMSETKPGNAYIFDLYNSEELVPIEPENKGIIFRY